MFLCGLPGSESGILILNTENLLTGTDDAQIVTRIKNNHMSHVAEYRKINHISRMLEF